MRILFISGELIGSAIIHRLLQEGHEVKLYIRHEDRKLCFEGIAPKTDDWRNELDWVGKEGLIVFDDVIFEGVQDVLRQDGYSVIGGNSDSDRLELDRQLFHEILAKHGIQTLPSYDFDSADEAMEFVTKNVGKWVVKQSSHNGMLNYVGQREDAEDVLDVLESYKEKGVSPVHLQERVHGVEIGVARYFNGRDWVGPIEVNLEHKPLCNGDIGPLTYEMGTLMWYEENEELPIYQRTLAKIKDYLVDIEYKGDIDINCIVNENNIWPLEATMRFGTPSTAAQCQLHLSPWADFMKAVADGEKFDLKYRTGFGIVISVAVPPFPYAPEFFEDSNIETCQGLSISFKEDLSEDELLRIHFEEAAISSAQEKSRYYLAGKHGSALYVTGYGETVQKAQTHAYDLVKKIILPKMFYRTDIGDKFIHKEQGLLNEWGWL